MRRSAARWCGPRRATAAAAGGTRARPGSPISRSIPAQAVQLVDGSEGSRGEAAARTEILRELGRELRGDLCGWRTRNCTRPSPCDWSARAMTFVPFRPGSRIGYRVDAETGCWIWIGAIGTPGYGRVA